MEVMTRRADERMSWLVSERSGHGHATVTQALKKSQAHALEARKTAQIEAPRPRAGKMNAIQPGCHRGLTFLKRVDGEERFVRLGLSVVSEECVDELLHLQRVAHHVFHNILQVTDERV